MDWSKVERYTKKEDREGWRELIVVRTKDRQPAFQPNMDTRCDLPRASSLTDTVDDKHPSSALF